MTFGGTTYNFENVEEVDPPATEPQVREDCMGGGWKDYEFKNQGQCIAFVQSNENSKHHN